MMNKKIILFAQVYMPFKNNSIYRKQIFKISLEKKKNYLQDEYFRTIANCHFNGKKTTCYNVTLDTLQIKINRSEC